MSLSITIQKCEEKRSTDLSKIMSFKGKTMSFGLMTLHLTLHQEDNFQIFFTNPQNYINYFHAIKQDKGEAWSEQFSAVRG